MEDDVAQPSGNLIPVAVAMLGIVLGTAGLYFGYNANKRLNSIDTSIQDNTTSKAEIEKTIGVLEARVFEQENRILEQEQAISRLRAYLSQSEQAIKKITGEVNVNRKQINELRSVAVRNSKAANDLKEQTVQTSGKPDESQARAKASRTYVIVSGDTFGRIANRFGVSVESIIDANPDADPRRLAIGQKITIPSQ